MSTQALEARMGGLEARMSHIEGAFDQVNERLSNLERRFDQLFESIDHRFNWVIGTVFASWITTVLTILFHR